MKAGTHARTLTSVEALNRNIRMCTFPKADITILAKRLLNVAGRPPNAADPADPSALKVEKNALALVFIPAVTKIVEEFGALHPRVFFNLLFGELGMIELEAVRASVDPHNPQPAICNIVHQSLGALFQHMADGYVLVMADAAANDAEIAWTVKNLLERYRRVVLEYHAHTQESARHFTPQGHIMAGINTALFIILRVLSAIAVLGEARLRRPLTRDEVASAMRNTLPLLMTIARSHLDQLLALEVPLAKQADLYFSRLNAPDYAARIGTMFEWADDDELRLELAKEIRDNLPILSNAKPRTGCPALYASVSENVNAIATLARMAEQAFTALYCAP